MSHHESTDHGKHVKHHAKHELHHAGHLFVEKAAAEHHSGSGHGESGEHHAESGEHHAEAGDHHADKAGAAAGAHHEEGSIGAGDVAGAAAVGLDVGGIMARRRNEEHLVASEEEKKRRTKAGLAQAGLVGGAAVGGMAIGKGLEHLGVPGAGVAGVGLTVAAAGAATADKELSGKDRIKVAASAGGAAVILGGAHEAAAAGAGRLLGHGEFGIGAGAVAGRIAGAALVAKSGQRMTAMRDAFGEGIALVAAGVGLRAALGTAAPVPLGVVNEYKRKGLEFSGGHVLAVGKRNLSERKESVEGEAEQMVLELQREDKGCQVRVGGGAVLMPVGAASAGVIGAALGAAVGGLVGVGGNVGITRKKEMQEGGEGVQKASGEKMKGFSGGFDVVGLEWLNLDTGKLTYCRVEIGEDGEYSIEQDKSLKLFGRKIWSFSDASWRANLKKGKPVMLFIKIPKTQAVVWVPAEVTTSWKNCVSVKYGEGDNEVRRLISRKSKDLCRPLLPVCSDPSKEARTPSADDATDHK